jgi:hypothetical protein
MVPTGVCDIGWTSYTRAVHIMRLPVYITFVPCSGALVFLTHLTPTDSRCCRKEAELLLCGLIEEVTGIRT